MSDKVHTVLFLCTGNSARSILAEALLNHEGRGRFRAYSAGSFPKGAVHPMAIELLRDIGIATDGLRSKSWEEFAGPEAPAIDMVITVCDDAAGEVCPIWPGHPVTAHWGIEDPAAVEGPGKRDAFVRALGYLRNRIRLLLALRPEAIDRMALRSQLQAIGRGEGATEKAAGQGPVDIIIYHNPECGTSRNTLGLIRNAGIEPHVIEYLKTPPARALLEQLIARAGITPRALLREKGTPYADLGLDDESLPDSALIDAMMAHPILINRPIVVSPLGVRLCRPSEAVLDLLPARQRGAFAKEDGEQVIDAQGRRVGA